MSQTKCQWCGELKQSLGICVHCHRFPVTYKELDEKIIRDYAEHIIAFENDPSFIKLKNFIHDNKKW